jgi:hypothetical protein
MVAVPAHCSYVRAVDSRRASLMSTDLREQLQTTLGRTYTLEHELRGAGMSRVFVGIAAD